MQEADDEEGQQKKRAVLQWVIKWADILEGLELTSA